MIKIATVFSGIGAPEEALRQLGVRHEVVFACDNGERELKKSYEEISTEIESLTHEEIKLHIKKLYDETKKENYVRKSYFANNPDMTDEKWYEDVRFIDGNRYNGQVDILVGGSPCQSFSTYGKKKGFEDTRGTLFFHYATLIKTIRPKVFIYENVPGLKSHNKGQTWERIQEIFEELDYDIKFKVLNAADYGLPQKRDRIFVVGFDKSLEITDFEFPSPVKLEKTVEDYLETNVDLKYYLGKKGFEWVTTPEKHQGRSRINRRVMCCQTATQQFNWTGDFRLEEPTQEMIDDDRIYKGVYEGKLCVARKLTPSECLKLMGFENFKIEVNDINAYRQSGNSIAVPVLKFLFEAIFKKLNK